MRKYLLLALLIASSFISLQAMHYPVVTIHSVKCIEHNDTSIEWNQETGFCYCVDVDGDSVYIGTDNGVLVFSDGSFHWLNDTEAGVSEPTVNKSMPSRTFDLQGRRLNTEPKHGMYIQNGKKFLRLKKVLN